MINWNASHDEHTLMVKIAHRAYPLYRELGLPDTLLTLSMDINACHSNGCPLDLAGLLAAPESDFSHDVLGIRRHIDRKTGELQDCFVPRYAKANHAS